MSPLHGHRPLSDSFRTMVKEVLKVFGREKNTNLRAEQHSDLLCCNCLLTGEPARVTLKTPSCPSFPQGPSNAPASIGRTAWLEAGTGRGGRERQGLGRGFVKPHSWDELNMGWRT